MVNKINLRIGSPKRKIVTQVTTFGASHFYDENRAKKILEIKSTLLHLYTSKLQKIDAYGFHAAVLQSNVDRIAQCIQSDASIVGVLCERQTALQYELNKSCPDPRIVKMLTSRS